MTCEIYAENNKLLDVDGWKQFKRLSLKKKKMIRMVNQTKLQSYRSQPTYKFGVHVPRNHCDDMGIDKRDGFSIWSEDEKMELSQIDDYKVLKDLGKNYKPPDGYKKITVHFVYDVKHYGIHKERLVAGGHLTDTPVESVYSSVVSLRGLRISIFLAELNNMKIWTTDVGNDYLEAYTDEKVYIVGGPEFLERNGHTMIIEKYLYGLKSSGSKWWEKCSLIIKDMGFSESKEESDIWLRKSNNLYEYIVRYVDDLEIVSKDPEKIVNMLSG